MILIKAVTECNWISTCTACNAWRASHVVTGTTTPISRLVQVKTPAP